MTLRCDTHFGRLEVLDMSDEHFVQGLSNMGTEMAMQPPAWHEGVCNKLCILLRGMDIIGRSTNFLSFP